MEQTENTGVAKTKKELPTLADLHHDIDIAFKNDKLNLLLNQNPPANWVVQHPIIKKEIVLPNGQKTKVPSEYLPIDRVELLMARIFQRWRVEVLREGQMFNSVYVTVRVHYIDPVSGEWDYHDGVGAVGVQTDAGKSASDLGAIKQAAIQMALPAAKTYAIKDSCDHLGKLFGKDLNRQFASEFTMAYQEVPKTTVEILETKVETSNIPQGILDSLEGCTTKNEATLLFNGNPQLHQFPEFKQLVAKRHKEIELAKAQAQTNS